MDRRRERRDLRQPVRVISATIYSPIPVAVDATRDLLVGDTVEGVSAEDFTAELGSSAGGQMRFENPGASTV